MSHSSARSFAVALGVPLIAACGSVVVEPPGGSTTATGEGAGPTTVTAPSGGGGAGTTTTSSSTTTTGATGGGGSASMVCGGKAGIPCSLFEWCQFPPDAPCGGADSTGVCVPKPDGCTPGSACPGVCGCDGQLYCNSCEAHEAGVDVSPSSELWCVNDPMDTYRALNMFTNIPRIAFLKASPARNLCFRFISIVPDAGGSAVVGAGASVEVTSDWHDCDYMPGWPPAPLGESFMAASAAGMFTVSPPGGMSCFAGIHVTVDLAGAPAWAPPAEAMDADGLMVEGGCFF